jgi:hypothetical protein
MHRRWIRAPPAASQTAPITAEPAASGPSSQMATASAPLESQRARPAAELASRRSPHGRTLAARCHSFTCAVGGKQRQKLRASRKRPQEGFRCPPPAFRSAPSAQSDSHHRASPRGPLRREGGGELTPPPIAPTGGLCGASQRRDWHASGNGGARPEKTCSGDHMTAPGRGKGGRRGVAIGRSRDWGLARHIWQTGIRGRAERGRRDGARHWPKAGALACTASAKFASA